MWTDREQSEAGPQIDVCQILNPSGGLGVTIKVIAACQYEDRQIPGTRRVS